MMLVRDLFRLSLHNLLLHKVRSILTSLGVIFGVGSVIAMLAVSEGAKRSALAQIEAMGIDKIILFSKRPPLEGRSEGSENASVMELDNLLNTLLPLIQTNFTKTEIAALLVQLPGFLGCDVQQMSLPLQGTYGVRTGMDDRLMYDPDWAVNIKALQDFLYNDKTAEEVIAMIDAIGTVDLSKAGAISAARSAYDKLTDAEKALVTNYDVLVEAEAEYARLAAEQGKKLHNIYTTTGDYISGLGTPDVGSIGGEWMVIDLARSGRTVPDGYYEKVVEYVQKHADENERLHRAKSTDNSRIILALTAIGKDVTNVGGHNLLKGLDSMDYIQTQGINGPIWALIALDSHNYPTSGDVTREKLIQVILDAQLPGGGWNLSGNDADPDMTAMAIQALAPYYKTNETVKAAVDKALEALSALQRNDGGFGSWGTVNSESCAQVIVALTALGIDPTADSRFVKNGNTVLDALAGFYVTGGGFRHTAGGERNDMATEQGYYALAAYYRFANAQTRLYDMSDVTIQTGGSNTPATGDTGVLVWVIALPVTILAAAIVLKRKEREA